MTENDNIELKPTFAYWIAANVLLMALIPIILWARTLFEQHLIVQLIGAILAFIILLIILYRYVDMLLCTKWIITDEQIVIKRGVFLRSVNYIELYRITDYEERKTLIQMLLRNKSIIVRSGDKSHPELCMFGLRGGNSIIPIIRQRVEKQREIKQIYEFTNRG
jgi:uncharacterized membrane protein YdbT with pleckstrin-like domain